MDGMNPIEIRKMILGPAGTMVVLQFLDRGCCLYSLTKCPVQTEDECLPVHCVLALNLHAHKILSSLTVFGFAGSLSAAKKTEN